MGLRTVLEDIHENDLEIDTFVADNPKRALVREALNHASYYPCEMCEQKGFLFHHKEEVNEEHIKRNKNIFTTKFTN